jgi:diketogulonate reductase-like aldo/keto reductase
MLIRSGVRHLKEMEEYANIPPAVNQIEVGISCEAERMLMIAPPMVSSMGFRIDMDQS